MVPLAGTLPDWAAANAPGGGASVVSLELTANPAAGDPPLTTTFSLDGLVYERREVRAHLPSPTTLRGPIGIKAAVRSAIDWETVTPVEELPGDSLTAKVKRELRRWKGREAGRA